MKIEDNKIYLNKDVVAVLDEYRKVVQIFKKEYLNEILAFTVSNDYLSDYRWEAYSPEE